MRTTDHALNTEPLDSHAASISRFMNWAAERIAKEVEDNERIEKITGTREFIPSSRELAKVDYTEEEKINTINGIDKLRAEGQPLRQAIQSFGIHNTTYYKWKRELNK